MNEQTRTEIMALRREQNVAYVASVNETGYPQVKAMLVLEHESPMVHYFSTNTSSRRVAQFRGNPKAFVYYCDPGSYKGALFTGTLEVLTDSAAKAMLWREGFEMYYPKGVTDEDYCVLRFTAETVNYYHGLANATHAVKELL
ncbi:MAG TPA: pyridoxamine 5'-phosphate oxidase family protein [Candidatus Limiplasma sp.]|nr:pyridoxamine 5'-phosphate oxidase family protein [Candidatus Limiplasma sp.]HPS81580.1 pyridoxamine 5'-phosphate oxidase family protein [Candidatus Limiplasma sp.]